jgi:hypothetical protein
MRRATESQLRGSDARHLDALLSAKLRTARGQDASEQARSAMDGFRLSQAPWWIAKALRQVATDEGLAEALAIEAFLGIKRDASETVV